MNFKYKKQKYINGLRLGILLMAGCGLGACAYDPAEVVERRVEPQSKSSIDRSGDENEIPFDLVVSERFVLKNTPEKIRRLTLLEGSVLVANGEALKLDIEEIVSFGGIIEVDLPNPQTIGSAGGFLHITAKSGRGQFTIISRGKDGANGAKGSPGSRGAKGGNGRNAVVKVRADFMGGILHPRPYCHRHPTNGAPGKVGAAGGRGSNGGPGANSAAVLFELENPTGFQVSTDVIPGKGGSGGSGGDGGAGGDGGSPGKRDRAKICPAAQGGAVGPRGAQGLQGLAGKDGSAGPVCLKLGRAEVGECRDFDDLSQ